MTGPGSSCGACKFLRRRCTSDCLFAPYFSYEQAPSHFAAVHKVFGASNVSKLLLHLPVHSRSDAAETISYEALARMQDLVYGCVAHIFALQQRVAILKEEIEIIGSQMANLGVGIASCAVSHETSSNPYTVAPSSIGCDVSSHCSNQQSLRILHSGDTSVNQACCSHIELQHPGIEHETSKLCFDSSILERLLQDLSQDYYVHSPWMKNAAP